MFSMFEISLSSAINSSAILKIGFPSRLFPFSLPIILCSSTSPSAVCYIKTTGDESDSNKIKHV